MSMKSKYKSRYKRRSGNGSKREVLLILSIVLFCAVIGTGLFLFFGIKSKNSKKERDSLRTVYVAKEEIERGHKITASLLEQIQINPEMPIDYYCTSACLEQVAAVDIKKGMPVLNNMICSPEIEEGQREVECEILSLSDNLVDNDYVDVRIMMPNGEDYIVLAKKSVHELTRVEDNQEERCYLWMSEDEILCYSAAIVDAYLYPGSSLYTTRYIEPAVQEPSITTYVPSIGTITMMKENPNLLQEAIRHLKENDRKQLENRLTYYLNKDIREVLWKETESPTEETERPIEGAESPTKGTESQTEETEGTTESTAVNPSSQQSDDTMTENKEEALSVFVDDSKIKEESAE